MIAYNNQGIKLLPNNAPIPLHDKKYALHKTAWDWPCIALYGPPTYCGVGHFWAAWYFQMRRPDCTFACRSRGTRTSTCIRCTWSRRSRWRRRTDRPSKTRRCYGTALPLSVSAALHLTVSTEATAAKMVGIHFTGFLFISGSNSRSAPSWGTVLLALLHNTSMPTATQFLL